MNVNAEERADSTYDEKYLFSKHARTSSAQTLDEHEQKHKSIPTTITTIELSPISPTSATPLRKPTKHAANEHSIQNSTQTIQAAQTKSNYQINTSTISEMHCEPASTQPTYKLYRRRWLILFCFCLFSFSNGCAWLTYAPIASIFAQYFQVNLVAINSLSTIFMGVYVVGAIHASLLCEVRGLRFGMLIGVFWNTLGAIIRVNKKTYIINIIFDNIYSQMLL
jgi:hypothetical protein